MKTDSLLAKIEAEISSGIDQKEGLQLICKLLHDRIESYDWVGYYLHHPEKKELVLHAYVGESTEHTNIPFGKGICGQVAESNQTFLVEDVAAQDNYIACDLHVKSEIVVPLFVEKMNVGQIDIDSNTINAFGPEDAAFLEELNALIAHTLL